MRLRTEVARLAFSLGFMSTAGQVIVIRELLVASTGNELTIAITLAVWILAVAAGSYFSGALAPGRRPSPAGLLIIAALALPFQVVLIRTLHTLVGTFGEMMSPGATVALTAAGVLPCAALSGAIFVCIVSLLRAQGSSAIGWVYGIEAVGSAAAGLALSFYLMELLNPIVLAGVIGLVGLASAWMASEYRASAHHRRWLQPAAALVLGVILVWGGPLDRATRQKQWGPLRIERIVDSRYSSIVVAGHDGSHDVFETGTLSLSLPDLLLAEETVHLPLLLHPQPRRVLLVGGAGSGAIGEILKHPSVERADYVEIDPVLVSTVRAFAPPGWLEGTPGRPVAGHLADGRRFVAETRDTFDVVIVGVGAPTTLQVNRYYTEEFFRSVAGVLAPDGLVGLKVAAPGAYAGPGLATLVASIANACRRVFPQVRVLPGDYIHVVASPSLDLRVQTGLVEQRLQNRNVKASFVNQYVLWDRLSELRTAQLDSVVARYDPGRANSDLEPLAFAASMTMWQKSFGWRGLSRVADTLTTGTTAVLILLVGLVAALGLAWASGTGLRAVPGLLTLYAVGLATMATQVLLVLGFQIACGSIYSRVAGLVAAFMAGMGLAAMLAAGKAGRLRWRLAGLPALLAVPPLAVAPLLRWVADAGAMGGVVADLGFPALAWLTGSLGGIVFARTSAAIASDADPVWRAGSAAYSADLVGACVAGLATGLLMVPALGVAGSAYATAAATLLAVSLSFIAPRVFPGFRPR